ncbi:MAG: hypothetical protein F6K17_04610 [Okeania sp. SIO3C4]|nr:hypothetical protein [Okeania sp. SIO3C4]
MPGYIEPVGMRELNKNIKELNETVKNTNLQLPEILKVSIPSIETPPVNIHDELSSKIMSELAEAKLSGKGKIEYFFADGAGIILPTELQPQLSPTDNWIEFAPEPDNNSIFRLRSSYSATSITPVTQEALDEYNTQNNTTLVLPEKEVFTLPLLNKRSSVITLSAHITHDRTSAVGTVPGTQTTVVANWQPGTNVVEVQYPENYISPLSDGSLGWTTKFYMTRTIPFDSIAIFGVEE